MIDYNIYRGPENIYSPYIIMIAFITVVKKWTNNYNNSNKDR